MAQTRPEDDTQERLLTEAEILFAKNGYRGVTVREVTDAAQANLASVNYYFGSKNNLYLEVFRRRWIPRAQRINAAFAKRVSGMLPESFGIRDVVEALAHAILEGGFTEEERFRHHQLMGRELAEPTEAFELVIELAIRPMFRKVIHQFSQAPDCPRTEEELALCCFSVFGMILYFNFARPVISAMTGRPYDSDFTARVVRHIVDFSSYGFMGKR